MSYTAQIEGVYKKGKELNLMYDYLSPNQPILKCVDTIFTCLNCMQKPQHEHTHIHTQSFSHALSQNQIEIEIVKSIFCQ